VYKPISIYSCAFVGNITVYKIVLVDEVRVKQRKHCGSELKASIQPAERYSTFYVLQLSFSLFFFDAKYEENTSPIMCWGRE
jgi:hypothetical protein